MPAAVATNADASLDQFMPQYDVAERHSIRLHVSADSAMQTACNLDLRRSRLIRALFTLREWLLRSKQQEKQNQRELVTMLRASGWKILENDPGREIVLGTLTCPWEPDVVFHPIPAEEFAGFQEPGWVKIAVSIRADPVVSGGCILQTETRVHATCSLARSRFLRYWRLVRPGVALIRRIALHMVKREAHRRLASAA